jgi:hypothetical protein
MKMSEYTNAIEVINCIQKLRKKELDFESISDKFAEQNIALEVRWSAIDVVKHQEENLDKSAK